VRSEGQADKGGADVPAGATPSLFMAIFVLAAAGVCVILLSASLGAATSGRSLLSSWFGAPGVEPARESIRTHGHKAGQFTQPYESAEVLDKPKA
jgi:hypothetical protein